MKWSLAAFAVCTLSLTAQDQPAGQLKHLSVPTRTNVNPISVAALAIEREGEYPAIIPSEGKRRNQDTGLPQSRPGERAAL